MAKKELNLVVLVKGEEKFAFVYDDLRAIEAKRQAGRMAADPALSFNWYDAALVTNRICEMEKERRREPENVARF